MDRYEQILKEYWGHDHFRGIQRDIIESIGNGHDTLGLMPTGGGKSITFQVPALDKEGTCLVITPLIALMKDQVQNLRNRGIKATAIYSGLTRQEILTALDNCILGDYKFLYISPERIATEVFQTKLRHMRISFITIDEAHCISQWGYDFRPSYLQISQLRQLLPDKPVLALTATATPSVVLDIQDKLQFRQDSQVYRMSFKRDNLSYVVRHTNDKLAESLHILSRVPGAAIIYVRNRKMTREVAEQLQAKGITATFYHAGLAHVDKDKRQKEWQVGTIRVMVATNAFGMGIDKPDVRTVIHIQTPDSPEAYFQEAGRAGRDGKRSYAILLYHPSERRTLLKRIHDEYPEKETVRQVYEHLAYYYQMAMGDGLQVTREFNLEEFCHRFKHFPVQAYSCLKLLTQAGYIEYTDEQDHASRLMFTMHRDELYNQHLDAEQEQVVHCLLRIYSGLFSDYSFIEESRLARLTNLTDSQVYEQLKGLSRMGIVHYIPRKKAAYITYTQKRVEMENLVFAPEVYDQRKDQYNQRIQAMLNYAGSTEECRSRLLLAYFGETDSAPCGECDVCKGTGVHSNAPSQRLQLSEEKIQVINGQVVPTTD